ncbi:MAG: DUF4349 domain-containing protein [Nanoarchaeota archaeon]
MSFKDWVHEHAFGIAGILIVVLFLFVASGLFGIQSSMNLAPRNMAYATDSIGAGSAYTYQKAMADFAPEVEDRKIAYSATLATQVRRGTFDETNDHVHRIIDDTKSFIISENIAENNGAKSGSYNMRVPSDAYTSVVEQLKATGEVQSFVQSSRDITGTYVNNDIELVVERERLKRLESLYAARPTLDEKLRLESAIFDQERKIKYLEDSLANIEQTVEYSTIQFTLREKPSSLAGLSFLGFGDLVKTFVASLKSLLYFLFAVLPWAIMAAIVWYILYLIRRKRPSQKEK